MADIAIAYGFLPPQGRFTPPRKPDETTLDATSIDMPRTRAWPVSIPPGIISAWQDKQRSRFKDYNDYKETYTIEE